MASNFHPRGKKVLRKICIRASSAVNALRAFAKPSETVTFSLATCRLAIIEKITFRVTVFFLLLIRWQAVLHLCVVHQKSHGRPKRRDCAGADVAVLQKKKLRDDVKQRTLRHCQKIRNEQTYAAVTFTRNVVQPKLATAAASAVTFAPQHKLATAAAVRKKTLATAQMPSPAYGETKKKAQPGLQVRGNRSQE